MNPAAECEQNTEAWRQFRCGYVTASRMEDVLRKPRKGQEKSTSREAYLAEVISERLTGQPIEREWESYDTRRGRELEPIARTEYSQDVETAGFIEHPKIAMFGCSPDGLMGTDGLCQIKAPRRHVHLEYIEDGILPTKYRPQMLAELACTGRKWNDFVSYNKDFPPHLQLFVVRLNRNEAEITKIEEEVIRFLADVEAKLLRLPKRAGQTALEAQLEESLKITNADIAEGVDA